MSELTLFGRLFSELNFSLTEAQQAAAWFAMPFLTLTFIWLSATTAFAIFDDEADQ